MLFADLQSLTCLSNYIEILLHCFSTYKIKQQNKQKKKTKV